MTTGSGSRSVLGCRVLIAQDLVQNGTGLHLTYTPTSLRSTLNTSWKSLLFSISWGNKHGGHSLHMLHADVILPQILSICSWLTPQWEPSDIKGCLNRPHTSSSSLDYKVDSQLSLGGVAVVPPS